jgi:hypothetical protein
MQLAYLWLFLFGCAVDILWCLSVQCSATFKNYQATLYTVLLTSVQLWANWEIIKSDSVPGFIAFVGGCALGTWFATTPAVRRIWKK